MNTGHWRALFAVAFLALSVASSGVRAQEVVIVTGEHWTKSGNDLKKAYLLGIANILQVELAYLGNNQVPDAQNFAPRMARGSRGETVDSVREKIDAWYATLKVVEVPFDDEADAFRNINTREELNSA